jgi:hypothetical protein
MVHYCPGVFFNHGATSMGGGALIVVPVSNCSEA